MSMRSTAGGVGMPTGDGVTNSPTSPFTSATTPENGARRRVWSRAAWATSSCERLTSTVDRAALQAARLASASLSALSTASSEARLLSRSCRIRSASRPARSATIHACCQRASADRTSLAASWAWACRSTFQNSMRIWPCSTTSPSFTGMRSICPPRRGEIPARRQASMVPALVLATVD